MIKRVNVAIILFLLVSLTILFLQSLHNEFAYTPTNKNHSFSTVNCRKIQHTIGEICVPPNSQDIVTLDIFTLSNTLALGVKPIGSVTSYEKDKFPTYLKAKTRGIKLLGIHYQPNLERILLLKPDLIVGWDRERAIYPLLSTIAPTILGKWQGFPSWREYFNFIAEALGKKEAAQYAWDRYYQRIKELKIFLGEGYQNKKISFIYFCCHGIGSDVKNSFIGSILNDAGLQRPETQDVITFPYGIMNVSEEELDKADGDILFVAAFTEDDKSYLKKLEQKPLWKKLKAVQQNHVYFVNGDAWRGGNLIAANFVIDDLFKYLVNKP